jgi:chemotaxis protein histidine kinase CheA
VGGIVTTDNFAERFAAVRERFAAKLDSRIDEIESTVPRLNGDGALDALSRAHRRAHDLCGIGPTMGFVATGQVARTVEQLLLAPLKAERTLNAKEIAHLRQSIEAMRSAARTDTTSAKSE